jgi:hypothetical protein
MKAKDLRRSRFLHEMCGGLHVKLIIYRRGTDPEFFKWYAALYKFADVLDPSIVDQVIEQTEKRYPWRDEEIDTYFVMSHKWRVKINHVVNLKLAARQERTLFIRSPGEMPGIMMQPQEMHIWEGIELLCHRRKYAANGPVNGGVYTVYSWDAETVTVRLNEEYRQSFRAKPQQPAQEDEADKAGEGDEDDDDAASEPDDFCEDYNDEEERPKAPKGYKFVDTAEMAGWYTLTHAEVARVFRLQHALVYANIQGRTMRDKHICLLDTANRNFTVRHLIVALSRATHGKYAHVPDGAQEAGVKKDADRLATTKLQRPVQAQPPAPRRPDVTFDTAQEWLEYSRNRGVLVEQLYKRPNWRQCLNVAREKNDLRKKLLSMTSEDLVELLVQLDAIPIP